MDVVDQGSVGRWSRWREIQANQKMREREREIVELIKHIFIHTMLSYMLTSHAHQDPCQKQSPFLLASKFALKKSKATTFS